MENNSTLNTIHERKSVRFFEDKDVSLEDLETLVRAGMASPSAVNKQPWAFFVITDKSILNDLGDKLPYAKMVKKAPAAIVVCGDVSKALEGIHQDYWIVDCAMASQNILLAAEAIGLGGVYTAVWPGEERVKPVVDALNLPENFKPLNLIPIGYPTGKDKPKDNWKPENYFINGYEPK